MSYIGKIFVSRCDTTGSDVDITETAIELAPLEHDTSYSRKRVSTSSVVFCF